MNYLDLRSTMKSKLPLALALLTVLFSGPAQAQAPTSKSGKELVALLNEFLDAAGRGDAAVFNRFFADDVIYTRSAGVTIGKSEIMKNVSSLAPTTEKKTVYAAQDVTVHDYGDSAVIAFRLVAKTDAGGKTETANYRNTGTFLRRGGKWQAVAWQSTKAAEK